jgi:hypothetical protein
MRNSRILSGLLGLLLLGWTAFVLAAFYVVQKPLALQVASGLLKVFLALIITCMLLLNAIEVGKLTIRYTLQKTLQGITALVLAGGLGFGELGLLGFGLAVIGVAKPVVLFGIQILLLAGFIWRGLLRDTLSEVRDLVHQICISASKVPAWMRWAAFLALILTFLMTFLPPVESFDALLYHLATPALWLRDGGLQAYNNPPYWFPDLVEGAYVWGVGLGLDIVPQQIHFLWTMFAIFLLWDWTRRLWGDLTAWWVLMLLVSMPSLPLLASWAYTDMALTFFSVAMLYSLWEGHGGQDFRWWRLGAVFAGMAMGVKYTSVIVCLTAVLLISIWMFDDRRRWITELFRFCLIAILVGGVWYLRNWLWMGNPFYPFVFAGRYWDSYRSALYAGAGTGSGWNALALIALPLNITLGYQDVTFYDGRIGPLFLLILPIALWVLIKKNHLELPQRSALGVIGLFFCLSTVFWVFGYITTRNLWQARLLFPALIPFAVPAALGMQSIKKLDLKKLRISFIVTMLAALVIFVNLLDTGLRVVSRNPLAVAVGIVSQESYTEKYQPGYAMALKMIAMTPQTAKIYFLFEPRSYEMARDVQPDTLLDNFAHDLYLYRSPQSIVDAWHSQGYTHVLLNNTGARFVLKEPSQIQGLNETTRLLKTVSISPDRSYTLYEIPDH